MGDFSPPPFSIRDQILATEKDAYEKQGNLLKLSVYSNVGMGVGIIAFAALAGWAINTPRDHLYAVATDELGRKSVVEVKKEASTEGAKLEAAQRWIHDIMTMYQDEVANERMRFDVIAKTFATKDEKEMLEQAAIAQLESKKGFVAEVGLPVQFEEVGKAGNTWTAVWTVTFRDMREKPDREPTVTKTYSATIQTKDVDKTLENLDGILFIPMEPTEIKPKGKTSDAK